MRKDIKFQIFLLIFANIKAILLSNAYFTLILQPKLDFSINVSLNQLLIIEF